MSNIIEVLVEIGTHDLASLTKAEVARLIRAELPGLNVIGWGTRTPWDLATTYTITGSKSKQWRAEYHVNVQIHDPEETP